jgi:DNA-binding NarL/FixJ family response regulator
MTATPVSIVEDDPSVRRLLQEWIEDSKDFRCISAFESAEAAVSPVFDTKPAVVLVDINLPGMNGVEFVQRMKPRLPDTQFVVLTVHEDTDHIFNALAAGASGYLLKGIDREELVAALRVVNAGGSPMTSYIARRVVQSFHRIPADQAGMPALAPREREVLDFLAQGYYYKEIADALSISVQTVGTYVRRIYTKLQVRSRGQAVAKYTEFRSRAGSGPPS